MLLLCVVGACRVTLGIGLLPGAGFLFTCTTMMCHPCNSRVWVLYSPSFTKKHFAVHLLYGQHAATPPGSRQHPQGHDAGLAPGSRLQAAKQGAAARGRPPICTRRAFLGQQCKIHPIA